MKSKDYCFICEYDGRANMIDTRAALKSGTSITVSKDRIVLIKDEVGRGGNCIVYNASYKDSINVEHSIRVKECYPAYLLLNRDNENNIIACKSDKIKFENVKKEFVSAYKRNADIRNTIGLMNSTINSTDIFSANNTKYIIMTLDEGMDYRQYEDSSLKELFEHIRSIAGLIDRYHKNGYLHLDIKPENVLILPETEEHIILFDFDSVVNMGQLQKGAEYRLSFSDGFSAPEQIQGRIKSIGCQTDIYSFGALVFFKIFGYKPRMEDCKLFSRYDFQKMKYRDVAYQPKLFRLLTNFFRKTLALSTAARWNNIELVINALDELIEASDTEKVFVRYQFTYNTYCFVGRYEEICDIKKTLDKSQLVFLSGIGGIGKTELARKYASEQKNKYDTIVFTRFNTSVQSLVCDDIAVNGMERDEDESEEAYFKRKISILKEILTENDLIIVDNFDVENDENIEALFECPCKFIITTREDFSDWNYPQINVGKIADPYEIAKLFRVYNDCCYSDEENEAVEAIIKLVDNHTMAVELIAKYLRYTGNSPTVLYSLFLEKQGVANTSEIKIKQRKDAKLRSESVNDHLRILFDISAFDALETEALSSLSLFAGARISRKKFEELCDIDGISDKLSLLIKRGWIEFDKITEKLSLHQIIQDLTYFDNRPNTLSCPHISKGMYKYITENTENYFEREVRKKLFDIFINRISGADLTYAKLCLAYDKASKLNEALTICLNCESSEAYNILQKIYRKQISNICEFEDMFETERDIEIYLSDNYSKILNLLEKIFECCKKYTSDPKFLSKELIDIGFEVDAEINKNIWFLGDDTNSKLDELYLYIIKIFDFAADMLRRSDAAPAEKEKLYQRLIEFYVKKDYCALYRYEHFADAEKAYEYQNIVNSLREYTKGENADAIISDNFETTYIYTNDFTYEDLAEQYENSEDYKNAIAYYKKAYDKGTGSYDYILYKIAGLYKKMGEINNAIEYLERALEIDKEYVNKSDSYFMYTGYVSIELIEILISEKNYVKAKEYAKELIYYNERGLADDGNTKALQNLICGYFYLWSLCEKDEDKLNYWSKCILYYDMLGNNKISKDMQGFIFEHISNMELTRDSMKNIMNIIDRIDEREAPAFKNSILDYLLQCTAQNSELSYWYIWSLLKKAEIYNGYNMKAEDKVLSYCKMAQEEFDRLGLKNEYLQNIIYKTTSEYMSDISGYYDRARQISKKCNYILITERAVDNMDKNEDNKIRLWQDTADNYRHINEYDKERYCLERALEIIKPILFKFEYSDFNRYWDIMNQYIRCSIDKQDFADVDEAIAEVYSNMVYCYSHNTIEKRDITSYIKWLAYFYIQINRLDYTYNMFIIELYFNICNNIDNALVENINTAYNNLEKLIIHIREQFDDGFEKDSLNTMIEIKEDMEMLLAKGIDGNPIISEILKELAEKHLYKEVDFKQ